MKNNSADISKSVLKLPPLEFGPFKHSLGSISHTLDVAAEKEIKSSEPFKSSTKTVDVVYNLNDGQRILLTKNTKLSIPEGVDGIVRRNQKGELLWVKHRRIEEITKIVNDIGLAGLADKIAKGWRNKFKYQTEQKNELDEVIQRGLRPPQIGGLFAIGAHWSLNHESATIVMPTGTGKTETMLASFVAYNPGRLLIVVPSRILRDQTLKKLSCLGLLRQLGNLGSAIQNPIVGVIKTRPKSKEDLNIFKECNVVVSTMSALCGKESKHIASIIPQYVDALYVDEAHHIAAPSWTKFKENFKSNKILQFTATPYRRDGKLVDGKVIFEYPLNLAQSDGYFTKIKFEPVYEIDEQNSDKLIATKAVELLRKDLKSRYDHIMMARCATIERAKEVFAIYEEIANDLSPILIHSAEGESKQSLEKIQSKPRKSRIVVCVNMLGEGFDLPQLKVAAIHDSHKSLAILLQFTGRFTRSTGDSIGEATIVANIADQDVSSALERLYSEDSDWNKLLSEFSSEAAKAHSQLVKFLNESEELDDSKSQKKVDISHHLLRPTFSTLMFESYKFEPKKFFNGLPKGVNIHRVWLHNKSNTLYFVTRREPVIGWLRSNKIKDQIWDLFILHYDPANNLLYLSSSDKSSIHLNVALAVGAEKVIQGDVIFRSLGKINRLIFLNVGVRKHGRRNLRFAMYTGSDVAEALSISERAGSVKSNLSGVGWENGNQVAVGCSYKGRVWTRDPGSVPEFINWCRSVGSKIKDTSIDTSKIIENVLIPEEIDTLPDAQILSIEWPVEILRQSEHRVFLQKGDLERSISNFDIYVIDLNLQKNAIKFAIKTDNHDVWANLKLTISEEHGYNIVRTSQKPVRLKVGKIDVPIEEYFADYPPLIRFMDLSELDGNLLIKPQNPQDLKYPEEGFEVCNWDGVNFEKESIWKNGVERKDSIQWSVANEFIDDDFDIVFDDDSAGEAADLICLKEEGDNVRLVLVHCKYSKGKKSGRRVGDVVEVSSQAVRSSKWKWKFTDLCRHILDREKKCSDSRSTRFLKGEAHDINKFLKITRFKEIKPEIVIVQPGLSKNKHTIEQKAVLAAAYCYLKETIGVNLVVKCSK